MTTIKPYGNESDSLGIGDLTVKSRTDRVSIYGSINLTHDNEGLQYARALKALMDVVIAALEGERDLPDKIAPPEEPEQVRDPLA